MQSSTDSHEYHGFITVTSVHGQGTQIPPVDLARQGRAPGSQPARDLPARRSCEGNGCRSSFRITEITSVPVDEFRPFLPLFFLRKGVTADAPQCRVSPTVALPMPLRTPERMFSMITKT